MIFAHQASEYEDTQEKQALYLEEHLKAFPCANLNGNAEGFRSVD